MPAVFVASRIRPITVRIMASRYAVMSGCRLVDAENRKPEVDIHVCKQDDLDRLSTCGVSGRTLARYNKKFDAQLRGDLTLIVAWRGDEPAGFVSLLHCSKYEPVRSTLGDFPELNALEATPQNRGIGTALVRFAEDLAHLRADRIGIAVAPGNPGARRLYERLGYEDWGSGEVVDRWFELDDAGRETVEQVDVCDYLIKKIDTRAGAAAP
jgi:RimJ/RimL family protein N-acetyltransferase